MAIMIILLTTSVGQPIILYIAAMGNIDNSLVEAARVDGATELQVFWKIKWPSLLPTTLYIAIITTINSFQCFALIQQAKKHPTYISKMADKVFPEIKTNMKTADFLKLAPKLVSFDARRAWDARFRPGLLHGRRRRRANPGVVSGRAG